MVVATFYDLFKSLRPHNGEAAAIGQLAMTVPNWITLAIGFVVSFVVAYGVVAWFMNWVRTRVLLPLPPIASWLGRPCYGLPWTPLEPRGESFSSPPGPPIGPAFRPGLGHNDLALALFGRHVRGDRAPGNVCPPALLNATMTYLSRLFVPTQSKRLNELVGILLIATAALILLALASYSPLDRSLNTAANPPLAGPRTTGSDWWAPTRPT